MQNVYQEKMQLSRNINSKFAHDNLLTVMQDLFANKETIIFGYCKCCGYLQFQPVYLI